MEGFKLDFEVPQTVAAGTTMRLEARLQQHQLPQGVRAPTDGLLLRVPFWVPSGGLVEGAESFGGLSAGSVLGHVWQ